MEIRLHWELGIMSQVIGMCDIDQIVQLAKHPVAVVAVFNLYNEEILLKTKSFKGRIENQNWYFVVVPVVRILRTNIVFCSWLNNPRTGVKNLNTFSRKYVFQENKTKPAKVTRLSTQIPSHHNTHFSAPKIHSQYVINSAQSQPIIALQDPP